MRTNTLVALIAVAIVRKLTRDGSQWWVAAAVRAAQA